MTPNPAVALALVLDLYAQAAEAQELAAKLQSENEQLRARLVELEKR